MFAYFKLAVYSELGFVKLTQYYYFNLIILTGMPEA